MSRHHRVNKVWLTVLAMIITSTVLGSIVFASERRTVTVKGKSYTIDIVNDNGNGTLKIYKGSSTSAKRVLRKKISKCYMHYCTAYGNKIYFNFTYDRHGLVPYMFVYNVSTGKFNNLGRFDPRLVNGRYAYGGKSLATDGLLKKIRRLDLKTGKFKEMGTGESFKIYAGKLYYIKTYNQGKTICVVRSSLNGTNEKVLKRFTPRHDVGLESYYIVNRHTVSCVSFKWKSYKIKF